MNHLRTAFVCAAVLGLTAVSFALETKNHEPSRKATEHFSSQVLQFLRQGNVAAIDTLAEGIPACRDVRNHSPKYKEDEVPSVCLGGNQVTLIDVKVKDNPGYKEGIQIPTIDEAQVFEKGIKPYFVLDKQQGYLNHKKMASFYKKYKQSYVANQLILAAPSCNAYKDWSLDWLGFQLDVKLLHICLGGIHDDMPEAYVAMDRMWGQAVKYQDKPTFYQIKWRNFDKAIERTFNKSMPEYWWAEISSEPFWKAFDINPTTVMAKEEGLQKREELREKVKTIYKKCRSSAKNTQMKAYCGKFKTIAQKRGYLEPNQKEIKTSLSGRLGDTVEKLSNGDILDYIL